MTTLHENARDEVQGLLGAVDDQNLRRSADYTASTPQVGAQRVTQLAAAISRSGSRCVRLSSGVTHENPAPPRKREAPQIASTIGKVEAGFLRVAFRKLERHGPFRRECAEVRQLEARLCPRRVTGASKFVGVGRFENRGGERTGRGTVGRQSDLDLILGAEGLALDEGDLGVMEQAIEER